MAYRSLVACRIEIHAAECVAQHTAATNVKLSPVLNSANYSMHFATPVAGWGGGWWGGGGKVFLGLLPFLFIKLYYFDFLLKSK